jgi:DtxR family Mn-dependent transcriptional regulator
MRKHRLAERLLADVIGLDWAYVHDEACRWEHVMSERVERRIYEMLDHPTESPYGNPIPGLAALGGPPARAFSDGVVNLLDAMKSGYGPESKVTVSRLAEPIQVEPELLVQLDEGGIRPGAGVSLERVGEYISVRVPGHSRAPLSCRRKSLRTCSCAWISSEKHRGPDAAACLTSAGRMTYHFCTANITELLLRLLIAYS